MKPTSMLVILVVLAVGTPSFTPAPLAAQSREVTMVAPSGSGGP